MVETQFAFDEAEFNAELRTEVDPDFGTGGLIGRAAVPLLDGADHDEENTTKD
jgi:hypothetical protein